MIRIPDLAPGCFGSALAFEANDMICGHCVFASQCEPVHALAKMELRKRFGIEIKESKKTTIRHEDGTVETVLPKRTQLFIDRINNANFDIVGKLQRGVNPFGTSMKFLAVACHLLLRMPSVKHEHITAACIHSLKCQQNTAEAYARIAVQVLTHVGAVRINDGVMTIKRD